MLIKRSEVESMIVAIQALDKPLVTAEESEETTGADGKTKKTVKKSEKTLAFDVHVRIALGQNVRRLRNELEAINEDQKALFNQRATVDSMVTEGENSKLVGRARVDFQKDVNELMSSKVEVDFVQIKTDDLKLEKNPIPIEVLGYLLDRVIITA